MASSKKQTVSKNTMERFMIDGWKRQLRKGASPWFVAIGILCWVDVNSLTPDPHTQELETLAKQIHVPKEANEATLREMDRLRQL
jgi:hypothetical protein